MLLVLNITIMPLNFSKTEVFSPKCSLFGRKFSDKIFRQCKIYKRGLRRLPPCHDATGSEKTAPTKSAHMH